MFSLETEARISRRRLLTGTEESTEGNEEGDKKWNHEFEFLAEKYKPHA